MKTADLDFDLPRELIAQMPAADRPASRLLHYRREGGTIAHRTFADLPSLLRAGDLLVFNNARVVPARFMLIKPTGGRVEALFVREPSPGEWHVLLKNVGPWTPEMRYALDDPSSLAALERKANLARIVEHLGEGEFVIHVETNESAFSILDRIGRMPLPPYIRREKGHDERDDLDRDRYQTVYAAAPGSVAAPTAGLHFDESILQQLREKQVEQTTVTLNVGLGTFKPVTVDDLEAHTMHVESYSIDETAAAAINKAKHEGRRVIAVGTTAARVLESQPAGELQPRSGETGIFIYPPYTWKHVNALVTNFHLPRSTLIALVAAFVGLEAQRRIYAEAIAERYRFFSYGDSSFLE